AFPSRGERVTAPWEYRDPLETTLAAEVSAQRLIDHVRTIAAWERESGSPGEAQAFNYIQRTIGDHGLDVERREIEAYISLPLEGRVRLDDGAVIQGLTHSFSPSVDSLEGEVVDVGDGGPVELARATGKIALVRGLATPGKAWAAQQAGTLGQIFVVMDHLHNMIVTTIWGAPTPETAGRIPATPCLSILRDDGERLRAHLANGPLRVRRTTRGVTCTRAASCTSTSIPPVRAAPRTTRCCTPPRTRTRSPRMSLPTSPASGLARGGSRAPAISRSGARVCPPPSCRCRGCRSKTPSSRVRWSGWSAARVSHGCGIPATTPSTRSTATCWRSTRRSISRRRCGG